MTKNTNQKPTGIPEDIDKIEEAFVLRHQQGWTMARIAKHFGASRKTILRWLALYTDKRSRYWMRTRFTRTRDRKYDDAVRNRIKELRQEVPTRPATTIHRLLQGELNVNSPSLQSVRRVLREEGLGRERTARRKNYIKFERSIPNDLWQIDFKGWNRIGHLGKLHLLAILDDMSRFVVAARWYVSSEEEHVLRILRTAFEQHGLPRQILSDNGSQFKSIIGENATRYYKILTMLGVEPIYHKPHHPETKGKLERWFGTVQTNFLPEGLHFVDTHPGATVEQFNQRFHEWLDWYNYKHVHYSLDGQAPGKLYVEHPKRFHRPLHVTIAWDKWVSGVMHRKVTKQGIISVDGKKYVLPDGFAGQDVEIRRSDGAIEVWSSGNHLETFSTIPDDEARIPHVTRLVAQAGTFKYKRKTYYIGYKDAHKLVKIQEAANGKDLLVYDGDILVARMAITDGTDY
nr:DDE-type integrase/transposase/recombinase [Candidatus Sigynarchaeota archaeon]